MYLHAWIQRYKEIWQHFCAGKKDGRGRERQLLNQYCGSSIDFCMFVLFWVDKVTTHTWEQVSLFFCSHIRTSLQTAVHNKKKKIILWCPSPECVIAAIAVWHPTAVQHHIHAFWWNLRSLPFSFLFLDWGNSFYSMMHLSCNGDIFHKFLLKEALSTDIFLAQWARQKHQNVFFSF